MAKTRELKRRIRSVTNTRKITRTMEMVSTSKLKRAQDRVVAARPYAKALAGVMGDLLSPELAERYPLLRRPASPAHGGPAAAAVLLITSNRGLAGAFNANLVRAARERVAELEQAGYTVQLHVVGKKGVKAFQIAKRALALARIDIGDQPTAQHAMELVEPLAQEFAAGRLASLDVVYGNFRSALSTPPAVLRVLPVDPGAGSQVPGPREGEPTGTRHPTPGTANYILKPDAGAILDALLPLYVKNQVYRALVETAASEHGARRTAMKNATDNAGDILGLLTRTYNRARQAQITQEIAEIVGGAAALQG